MRAHRACVARVARSRAAAGAKRRGRSRASSRVVSRAGDGDDATTTTSSTSWARSLETHFETDDADAIAGAPGRRGCEDLDALSPMWRVLLLSDGSVTRHLSVLGARERTDVEVSVASARDDDDDDDDEANETSTSGRRPRDASLLRGNVVRREVFLRAGEVTGTDGAPAVYAASWWSEDSMRDFMPDANASMWANLRNQHVELHREIRKVYRGTNAALEEAFGTPGPFWGRHYIFWSGGEPITVVYEVFNPALARVVGPP